MTQMFQSWFWLCLGVLMFPCTDLQAQFVKVDSVSWTIEVPVTYVKTSLSGPNALNPVMRVNGDGFGWKAGLGLKRQVLRDLYTRFFLQTVHTRFNAVTHDTAGTTISTHEEFGKFSYSGAGFRIQIEKDFYHFALGADFLGGTTYRSDHIATNPTDGTVIRSFGTNKSNAASRFESQLNLVFATGFRIELQKHLWLYPTFEFAAPLKPLFHSGVYSDAMIDVEREELNVQSFQLQFGAILGFDLSGRP